MSVSSSAINIFISKNHSVVLKLELLFYVFSLIRCRMVSKRSNRQIDSNSYDGNNMAINVDDGIFSIIDSKFFLFYYIKCSLLMSIRSTYTSLQAYIKNN